MGQDSVVCREVSWSVLFTVRCVHTLQHGADVDVANNRGDTPLHSAAK